MMNEQTYCGFVAIIGKPNVGKSTLLNTIMGKKLSITSFRAQTTRHQILAIKTQKNRQTIFVDTPGIHFNVKKAINKEMNKTALAAIDGVDGVIFVVAALDWTQEDQYIAAELSKQNAPIIVAINKVDTVAKAELLPFMAKINEVLPQATFIPISATKNIQIDVLTEQIRAWLPESPFHYPADQIYHQSDAFFISEIVREKITCLLDKEIPYATHVEVESMEERNSTLHIHTLIWVEREGQRKIMIGEKGGVLKKVGMMARTDLEWHFDKKVCLKLWVKVKENAVQLNHG